MTTPTERDKYIQMDEILTAITHLVDAVEHLANSQTHVVENQRSITNLLKKQSQLNAHLVEKINDMALIIQAKE